MKNTFIIIWVQGPAWVAGKTVREQLMGSTCRFHDQLFENGTVILGGPFADATGSMAMVGS